MLSITITDRSGAQRAFSFQAQDLAIGRVESNGLVLARSNVSKQHARIVVQEGRYVLSDLQSTNGTYVNGRRIAKPTEVREGDKIYIGDFILWLSPPASHAAGEVEAVGVLDPSRGIPPRRPSSAPLPAHPQTGPTEPPPPPAVPPTVQMTGISGQFDRVTASGSLPPPSTDGDRAVSGSAARPEPSPVGTGAQTTRSTLAPAVRLRVALATLMERLGEQIDIASEVEGPFPMGALHALDDLLDALDAEGALAGEVDRRFLREAAISEASGLGPLDALLRHDGVRDIVVDQPGRIVADLGGGLAPVASFFSSTDGVTTVARRLWARAGRTLGNEPSQQALLPDGTHVSVLLPPLSVPGPLISLRRPLTTPPTAATLAAEGVMSSEMMQGLRVLLQQGRRLLVTGTAERDVGVLCAALAGLVGDHERVVVIHGGPRIAVAHPQALCLTRLGCPEMSLAELLQQAARLRADRLVLDTLPSEDVLALLGSGFVGRGLIAGVVAVSPGGALSQLQQGCDLGQSISGERSTTRLAEAFDLVLHIGQQSDGSLRLQTIAEIGQGPDQQLMLAPRYRFEDGRFVRVSRPAGI